MTIPNGRKGMTTKRDEDILTYLYIVGCLSTIQIHTLEFGSHGRANSRLHDLANKRYLDFIPFEKGNNVWFLTKQAFRREAKHADSAETRPFSPPKERLAHYVKINDLYVALVYKLSGILGPPPEWQWYSEERARVGYERQGRDRAYRPDAELRFRGQTFVIERQTKEARASREVIYSRMADYDDYITNVTGAKDSTHLLWACDTERDMGYAREAGKKYDMTTHAGGVADIADYIEGWAYRLE